MEMASRARASLGTSLYLSGDGRTECFLAAQILQNSASAPRSSSRSPASRISCGPSKKLAPPSTIHGQCSPRFASSSWRAPPSRTSSLRSANAVEGNSASTTTDADRPSSPADKQQEEDNVVEYEEPESVGKAISQMKQESLLSGEKSPPKTDDFWRGVLEEIQLIEWPPLQKVLGTTGVVTGIIIGSSLVLLTVNALLARLSDAFFNNAPPA